MLFCLYIRIFLSSCLKAVGMPGLSVQNYALCINKREAHVGKIESRRTTQRAKNMMQKIRKKAQNKG